MQDEISNTIKPLDLMYKSAYRPVMKQRFEDMAVLLKSNLDEVVGRAADFATICTEYQQIEHFMRRYDEADRLLQENAEPDDIFDAGDGMAVWSTPSTIIDGAGADADALFRLASIRHVRRVLTTSRKRLGRMASMSTPLDAIRPLYFHIFR